MTKKFCEIREVTVDLVDLFLAYYDVLCWYHKFVEQVSLQLLRKNQKHKSHLGLDHSNQTNQIQL